MKNRSYRDYNPSRNSVYPTCHRHGTEKYAREAERSRRIKKRDRSDRDFNSRAVKSSVYDDRDIDRSGIRVRSSRSPRRVEIRGGFDRNERTQTVRLFEYDTAGKERDRDGRSRRFDYEDPHHMYSISPEFHRDFHLDGLRKSTGDNVKDYSYTSFHGAGDTDMTRGNGERLYSQSRYSDGGVAGHVSMEYGREGRIHSDSYLFDNGRIGGVIHSDLERDEFGSHLSETVALNSDIEKLGYFHLQNQLQLEKRNRALHVGEKLYSEKEEFDSHLHDRRDHEELRIGKPVERESSKYMEGNRLSSSGYVKNDSDFFSSLAQSESIYLNEYSEKRHYVSPKRHGDQRTDTRSCSRSYLGKHGDHFYAEFGKSKIDMGVEEYRDQCISRMSVSDSIVESSHGKRVGDDGLWDPYSSSRGRETPDKFSVHGSLHARKRDLDMYRGPITRRERSDVLRSREYEPSIGRLYDSSSKRLALQDPSLGEPSERRLGDERFRDDDFAHRASITKPNDAPNSPLVSLPKRNKSSKYDYKREKRMPSQREEHRSLLPAKFNKTQSSYAHKSDFGNIKRQLGPVARKHNLSQRVVNKYKPYIKKRLRPTPLKA